MNDTSVVKVATNMLKMMNVLEEAGMKEKLMYGQLCLQYRIIV